MLFFLGRVSRQHACIFSSGPTEALGCNMNTAGANGPLFLAKLFL